MKKSYWLRCSHATKFWLIERQGENPSAHSVAIKNQRAIDFITFSCGCEFIPMNPTNISSGGDLEIPFSYTLIAKLPQPLPCHSKKVLISDLKEV